MAIHHYKTSGTCSREIIVDVEDGIVKNVTFIGGCNGNTQGVSALCKNRPVREVISLLEGIKCGIRPTSCPDQLAKALKETL
ncbi:MAG: TIGR03905 family TSCPD domain-containing protein [Erysipelotrichaceae bacterium]|nr:TIGR03905 family TSCPD domain-containing protein [Erysipelotrichaceae bacterium]